MTSETSDPYAELRFEQALETLESIVQELEEGQVDLAQSLARYEQGVRLLRHCYQLLNRAERKIEQLSQVDSAGQPVVEPFDDANLTLDEKASNRGRRRSRRPSSSENAGPQTPPDDTEMDVPGSLF